MLQKKNLFSFGKIFKLHGYKGAVNIYNAHNSIIDIKKIEYFLVDINGDFVPYFINNIQVKNKNILLVNFEDVDTKEEASKLLKKETFLPEKVLHTKNSRKILAGYNIIDKKLGNIGKVLAVNEKTKQKLIIAISKDQNKEFYIPFHEKFVFNINHEKKHVEVNIPQEILELN